MTTRSNQVFPSKADWWIAVLLIGIPAALVIAGLAAVATSDVTAGIILVILGFFQAGLTALLSFPLHYTLTREALVIRSGAFRERIPYDEIREVVPSSNPLSAPALSLSRVKIVKQRGFRLISPVDRDRFIHLLRDRIREVNDGG